MNERTIYQHRQIGWITVIGVLGGIVLVCALLAWSAQSFSEIGAATIIVVLLAALVIFSTLTVRVTDRAVSWWFGIPAVGRRAALGDIESIVAIRTSIFEGWGIHLTLRHGWLWNVSGFNAVQITLRSGTRFAVGTPEPQAVIDAVARARTGN
jgi:hypothetical protein